LLFNVEDKSGEKKRRKEKGESLKDKDKRHPDSYRESQDKSDGCRTSRPSRQIRPWNSETLKP